MKKILCVAPENVFSKTDIINLESGLKTIFKKHYSATEKVVVIWMLMPEGYAFSERKASQAVIIMVEVNEGMEQKERENLMRIYSQFLLSSFNVSPLDSLITVANSSFVNQFFAAQRKRVRSQYRPIITLKLLYTALRTKLIHGYYKLKVSL